MFAVDTQSFEFRLEFAVREAPVAESGTTPRPVSFVHMSCDQRGAANWTINTFSLGSQQVRPFLPAGSSEAAAARIAAEIGLRALREVFRDLPYITDLQIPDAPPEDARQVKVSHQLDGIADFLRLAVDFKNAYPTALHTAFETWKANQATAGSAR